jgi:Cd2+/Zn2+-exporting ATPase
MKSETTNRLRLELPLLLPEVTDAQDRCVGELLSRLRGRPGIDEAHIVEPDDAAGARLCLHFDPAIVSVARLRELAVSVGAALTDEIGHVSLMLPAPLHARAARTLQARLAGVPGVLQAEVAPTGLAVIEYRRTALEQGLLREILSEAGAAESQLSTLPGSNGSKARERESHPGSSARHDAPLSRLATGDDVASDVEDHGHRKASEHEHRGDHRHEGNHDHEHGGLFGERTELVFSLVTGALVLAAWLIGKAEIGPGWLPNGLAALGYLTGGWFTAREALENLRARRFEIDTLMLVAAAGAAALGEWVEGALLLFLFSLGHALEHWAMGRARRAIEALAELAPERARVRRGDRVEEVPVEALVPGDIAIVLPNERIAADGVVAQGRSSVNQAPVTGESVPADKQAAASPSAWLDRLDRTPAEHRVYAGTINGSGAMEVLVARRAGETTLARVVRMVSEAEAQRSPTQRFTERFERVFVPVILGFTVLLLFAWLVVDEPFSASFYRAMAVLVAASPCALAISVPSAVIAGVARAARSGVLVKGGAALENLGSLTAIAFDKTGTLTEGRPRLTDVLPAEGVDVDDLLRVALAVEQRSDHPIAAAIVGGARERLGSDVPAADAVEAIVGKGVRARWNGEDVLIGKPSLFAESSQSPPPAALVQAIDGLVTSGRTTMVVRSGERYLGAIGVMDAPREYVRGVMENLRGLGVPRLVMLSGDNPRVANAVAAHVGLTEARGDLLPEDKVSAIQALRAESRFVAMVGDGVNDAPAMANATVGIAMGAAGSDVALETADVALMADDLSKLPFAVSLGRATRRVIRQNLWVSLGVVALLIPATLAGMQIGVAVLFHEGSTLVVVANALRLLAYSEPEHWRTLRSSNGR